MTVLFFVNGIVLIIHNSKTVEVPELYFELFGGIVAGLPIMMRIILWILRNGYKRLSRESSKALLQEQGNIVENNSNATGLSNSEGTITEQNCPNIVAKVASSINAEVRSMSLSYSPGVFTPLPIQPNHSSSHSALPSLQHPYRGDVKHPLENASSAPHLARLQSERLSTSVRSGALSPSLSHSTKSVFNIDAINDDGDILYPLANERLDSPFYVEQQETTNQILPPQPPQPPQIFSLPQQIIQPPQQIIQPPLLPPQQSLQYPRLY